MEKFLEFSLLIKSENVILRRIIYKVYKNSSTSFFFLKENKLNNQLGKHKIFNYLKELSKKINNFFSSFAKDKKPNHLNLKLFLDEILSISLKTSAILRAMIEKKFLIQFSTLSFAIVR